MVIFLFVMLVFMLAYGVGMNAILTVEKASFKNIFLRPYFLTTITQTKFDLNNKNGKKVDLLPFSINSSVELSYFLYALLT